MLRCGNQIRLTRREAEVFKEITDFEPADIRTLAEKTWAASRKTERVGRTVVLKLKTAQFRILTRSHTPEAPPASLEQFTEIALALRERVELPPQTGPARAPRRCASCASRCRGRSPNTR